MEQQIRHFKLLNGDDVIAFLTTNNSDSYIIEEPLLLVQNMTGNYNFVKWFPLSPQKSFKLYKTRVMQHVPVYENISEAYIKYLINYSSADVEDQQPKVQSYKELIQEMIMQEKDHSEELTDEDYYPLPDKDDELTFH